MDISEANMEEGQMRCDVNISLSTPTQEYSRVEIKNVLGLRFVEKCIEHEVKRQAALIEQAEEGGIEGEVVKKETRRYDAVGDKTIGMRSKEVDPDYRFLGEADLPCF